MNTKFIEGLSADTFVKQIDSKNKLHQAIALQAVEDHFTNDLTNFVRDNPKVTKEQIEKHKEENRVKFRELRKIFLDWSNEYTRSIIKLIFGDSFEGTLK